MKLVLSCPLGLESVAKKEIEMLGYTVLEARDRVIIFDGDENAVAKVNLWSRVGNKVYILLSNVKEVDTFDKLYDAVSKTPWKKFIDKNPIIVHAKSLHSLLTSTPSMQKIGKKAIVDSIWWKWKIIEEDLKLPERHIEIVLSKNEAMVMLDTSGEGLHKRWYRKNAVEAPIKENLAAWLVLLSGWKFKEPFYDIFCGSGTIAIEAALIAKNMAPWIGRKFAYEGFFFFTPGLKNKVIEQAKLKVFKGEYSIIGSDIDSGNIADAKENAKNAGVWDMITFLKKDFIEYKNEPMKGSLVSNPPYGDRLEVGNIDEIYNHIKSLFKIHKELSGGVVTSYDFDNKERNQWKRRKLYNGGKEVVFYKKNIELK